MKTSIYPWQINAWELLHDNKNRLHHAILLSGERGVGKSAFAESFAQALLCSNPDDQGYACCVCSSCHWFQSTSHPDFMLVSPYTDEKELVEERKLASTKKLITIEQVRTLGDFLSLSSHQKCKVVLINPAEGMNPSATNALLKMLEEPPQNTFFILVTNSTKQLLPTVRSRCHEVHIAKPAPIVAQDWLKSQSGVGAQELRYSGGNPLLAKEMLNYAECMSLVQSLSQGRSMDVPIAVSRCISLGMETCVIVLQKWLHDLLSIKLGMPAHFHDVSDSKIDKALQEMDLDKTFEFLNQLQFFKKFSQHPLNQELQFEALCINYSNLFTR